MYIVSMVVCSACTLHDGIGMATYVTIIRLQIVSTSPACQTLLQRPSTYYTAFAYSKPQRLSSAKRLNFCRNCMVIRDFTTCNTTFTKIPVAGS